MKNEDTVMNLVNESMQMGRNIIGVIDALAQRGGVFKGEELFVIGQLRQQATLVTQLAEQVIEENEESDEE